MTYGLNNKATTTIGADTATTITVNDGFWNAVGISNDPMYADMDAYGNYSNYNASDLRILGHVVVNVTGSGLGEAADPTLNGAGSSVSFERLTATYGLYAGVTAIDGAAGNYEDQLSRVVLGSEGKTVSFQVANQTEGSTGDVYGIYGSKADISVNGAAASLVVESASDGAAYGAAVEAGTKLAFSSDNSAISVKGKTSVGVSAEGADTHVEFNGASASITAEGEASTALALKSGAEGIFTGSTYLKADEAASVDASSKLVLNGSEAGEAMLVADGLVSNAGTTELTNGTLVLTESGSTLNQVTAKNGTVALGAGAYSIAGFSAESSTLLADDLSNLTSAEVGSASSSHTVAASSASNDQYATAEAAYAALLDKVKVGTDPADQTADHYVVQAGAANDGLEATKNEDGTWTSVIRENEAMAGFADVAALSALSWRDQLNDLTKRMGEIRDQPGALGAWARLYGAELEYGQLTNKSASVKVGADYQIGAWKVGGAFSYTDGSADYDLGSADNEIYTFGLYGTWLAENGMYLDIIGKYGRISNDFRVNGMKGTYDNNAFSFSMEAGWRLVPCAYCIGESADWQKRMMKAITSELRNSVRASLRCKAECFYRHHLSLRKKKRTACGSAICGCAKLTSFYQSIDSIIMFD